VFFTDVVELGPTDFLEILKQARVNARASIHAHAHTHAPSASPSPHVAPVRTTAARVPPSLRSATRLRRGCEAATPTVQDFFLTKQLRNLGALFRLTAYDPVVWQQVRSVGGHTPTAFRPPARSHARSLARSRRIRVVFVCLSCLFACFLVCLFADRGAAAARAAPRERAGARGTAKADSRHKA
jgi:hypothetical protein